MLLCPEFKPRLTQGAQLLLRIHGVLLLLQQCPDSSCSLRQQPVSIRQHCQLLLQTCRCCRELQEQIQHVKALING
jgi:hypothetical protein